MAKISERIAGNDTSNGRLLNALFDCGHDPRRCPKWAREEMARIIRWACEKGPWKCFEIADFDQGWFE